MLKEFFGVKGGVQALLLAAGLAGISVTARADMVGTDSTSAAPAIATAAISGNLAGGQLTPADIASFSDSAGSNPYVLFANSLSAPTAQSRQTQIDAAVFNFDAAHGISPESMPVPIPASVWLLLSSVILLSIARRRHADSA